MKKNILFVVFLTLSLCASLKAKSTDSKTTNNTKILRYLDVALILKESGEYKKAKYVLEEAVYQHRDDRLLKCLGRLYYLCSQPKESIQTFKKIQKKDWLNFVYLGLSYEDVEHSDLATDSYFKSLNLKPNSVALIRLAKIYRSKKDYKKAIEYFLRLIELDPSIKIAYYYLGECYRKIGENKKAYKFLAKTINFYPKFKDGEYKLANVKKNLGKDYFSQKKEREEKVRRDVLLSSYVEKKEIPIVRVGLSLNLGKISFSCGGDFLIEDKDSSFLGKKDKFYTIKSAAQEIVLHDYENNKEYKRFKLPVTIESKSIKGKKYPFYVLDLVYGQGDFWHKKIDRAYRGKLKLISSSEKFTLINILSIEEYIYGVLPAEISPNISFNALAAQAVAARTLAFRNRGRHKKKGFDFCSDVHCQVYHGYSVEGYSSNRAVDDTRGEILFYNNKPIEIFYHSNCGGCLRPDAFGNKDYLASGIDAKDRSLPDSAYNEQMWFFEPSSTFCSKDSGSKFRWQRVYDKEDFLIAFGFHLKDLQHVIIKNKGSCFHYTDIDIITNQGTNNIKGDLRIRNYFDHLRSSSFKVELRQSSGDYPKMLFFWGSGFGHGSGLCQQGAKTMSEEGYSYQDILNHYYPNTKLKKVY